MPTDAGELLAAVGIGIGATLLMDAWNVFLKRAFSVRSLDYCMLGRWVLHMPAIFLHTSISDAARRSGECAAGWIAHYSVGVSLALLFVVLVGSDWLASPTLGSAVLFGLATVVLPFSVLQPALGLGIASSKSANPWLARVKSVATHFVFGLGLHLCALGYAGIRAWTETVGQ